MLTDHGTAPRGIEMRAPTYRLEQPKKAPIELEDATWADWDRVGRLLVVTKTGRLQIRDADRLDSKPISDRDACAFEIDPKEAPRSAQKY